MSRYRHVLRATSDHTPRNFDEETQPYERRGSDDSNSSFAYSRPTPSPKAFDSLREEPLQSFFTDVEARGESIKIENNRNSPSPKVTTKKEKVVWDLAAKRRREYDALLRSAGIEPDGDDSNTESEDESETAELSKSSKTRESLAALRKRWSEKMALDNSVSP